MRGRHNIQHILYALNELAFIVIAVGLVLDWQPTSTVHYVALLTTMLLFLRSAYGHARLIQQELALRAADKAFERAAKQEEVERAALQTQDGATQQNSEKTQKLNLQSPAHVTSSTSSAPSSNKVADNPSEAALSKQEAAHPSTASPAEESPSLDAAAAKTKLDALFEHITSTMNPIDHLCVWTRDVLKRENHPTHSSTWVERFGARIFKEAGLLEDRPKLPPHSITLLSETDAFYLRIHQQQIPQEAMQRILKIEYALNALHLVARHLTAEEEDGVEHAYACMQRLEEAITAQAFSIDEPLEYPEGEQPDGEWSVRRTLSYAIETFRLPHRLYCSYRTNVADGNIAIEFDFTPAELFLRSRYIDGLGLVATTGDMRQRAAANYAMRVALLLAAAAFRSSSKIEHVWIAAVHNTASRRHCYLSVDFDRHRFSHLDLSRLGNLDEVYRQFAAVLRHEQGWLRPVTQNFSLSEERFCPSKRYMPVALSSRKIASPQAEALGTDHVSGLAIQESSTRALIASNIMLNMVPETEEHATEKNVRTILQLAADDPDPSVRLAAERVVNGLLAGTLAEDAESVGEEFVNGDSLSRAVSEAHKQLAENNPQLAASSLLPVLTAIDQTQLYHDSPTVVYRSFSNYAHRAMYNRTAHDRDKTLMLAPNAYPEAHLLLSIALLMQGNNEEALHHAQRASELAPFEAQVALHLTLCLDRLGRHDEAIQTILKLLELAHDPQTIALAYYRLAALKWQEHNIRAAQACYLKALQLAPQMLGIIGIELGVLSIENPHTTLGEIDAEELDTMLKQHSIPLAPTERISEILYDCTRAAIDAEVFPVARNFMSILCSFEQDDVTAGVMRSLEDEPDVLIG